MDWVWIALGVIVMWWLNKLIVAPIGKLIVNVIVGLIALYLINHFGVAFGLHVVPITWITGLIIGIFGLPGVAVVTVYYTFF